MKHILVIDDNLASLDLIGRFLEPFDCVYKATASRAEFLEAFEAGGWDLVVMDVHLPDWNVEDALSEIKSTEAKLLFVTGYPEAFCACASGVEEIWRSHFQKGNADILYKPFDRRELHGKVAPLIGVSTPICQLSDEHIEVARHIRQSLALHWFDLGACFIHFTDQSVEITGQLRHLPDAPTMGPSSIKERLIEEILADTPIQHLKITAEISDAIGHGTFQTELI